MSVKLLKDLNFAEKINATEAITEAGKEILNNYRAYVYTNPAKCGIVNGFVLEASKYSFDTGLKSILESVTSFISENNISWKLASACERIMENQSTYNYINQLGVAQVEKLLEMNESDVISYIKAGSLKNIQYIPEVRAVCKEVYKTNITEQKALNYTITNPISYVIKEDDSAIFNVYGKTFKIKEGKVEEIKCDDVKFNRINSILENFTYNTADQSISCKCVGAKGETYNFTINENETLTFTKGKINETFDQPAKFVEYANMLSRTMMTAEKLNFMQTVSLVNEVFESCNNIVSCDQVKYMNCNNGTQLAIIEAKDNVNLTIFHSINAGSSSTNYDYMVEALNNVIKVTGIDLKGMFEERINEDLKKLDPEKEKLEKELQENKEAQYSIRKKKIAMLAEQYKNDPVKLALLSKVAKDLAILENQDK